MKKWEAFFVGFLLDFVAAIILIVWSGQAQLADELSWFPLWTLGLLLSGVAFGLVPAIPILYRFEKA